MYNKTYHQGNEMRIGACNRYDTVKVGSYMTYLGFSVPLLGQNE